MIPKAIQGQKKALQLNVTVVITPQTIADAIRQLVQSGAMSETDAIEYAHEMIDAMQSLIKDFYTVKRIKI